MENPDIPLHRMDAYLPSGINFSYLEVGSEIDNAVHIPNRSSVHRDDYYLFLFIDTAEEAIFTIDFEERKLADNSVLYIRPGQVHFASSIKRSKGWYLMIDSLLVQQEYKNTFERYFHTQQGIPVPSNTIARLTNTARLLQSTLEAPPTAMSNSIIQNIANVFIGSIAEQYVGRHNESQQQICRSAHIAHQFRELLTENFKTMKSPTQYAETLNYSLSHLNESVKQTTGFPVSYWIHQQVILEAKRLLYYTDMDIRQIAFSLGYEDHTYFSRLFSKVLGMPPTAFRRKFHE